MSEQYVNVYRIEKRGRGPFRYYSSEWDNRLSGAVNCEHPTPYYDSGFDRKWVDETDLSSYRFGAPNVESLKEWIKKPDKLSELGFKVALYKVKKDYVHSSEIQSMFIKRHSKKVMEWGVDDFMMEN